MRRLALLVVLAACRTPTLPGLTAGDATTAATTGGSDGDTGGTTDACARSSDCDTTGVCVADFEPGATGGPGGQRGPAVCATPSDCIGALDLSRWCFDHKGCCDDLRCRTADGVCEPAGLGVTDGSSTADASTGPGGTTDETTGGGTTSGTSGTSGTDTGDTTGTTG